MKTYNDSPPWQVLGLVALKLDPKTLAKASCVSKTWFISMSSDHLWEPICTAHFPSLSALHAAAAIPYHRLYSLGHLSATRRRQKPLKPRLVLDDLIFTITVHNDNFHVFTLVKPGEELRVEPNGLFRFDIDVCGVEFCMSDEVEGLKVTWNVFSKGYKGVFTMMDCRGRGRFVLGSDGWFSEEMPSPGCCSGLAASGLVADLRLEMSGNNNKRRPLVVEKVGVGVLNILNWRCVSIDDVLRYLQHFLMSSSVV